MKKYTVELLGTFFFVLSIIAALYNLTLLTPLYIGISLATLVYMGGAISGAHYNPAVTFGLFLNKKIGSHDALWYVVSQLIGATLAFLVATKGLHLTLPAFSIPVNLQSFFIAELLYTFALVIVIYTTAVNRLTAGNSYFGIAIGAIVTVGALTVGKISGGFFNPAVLLGVGLFGITTKVVLALLAGQIIGAFGAAWVYRYVVGK
ncbi:aquaporin [Candidatus Gracilibacteria bacterium]|nr:aquaporin [Candidatus Gracilibacteria bacterium]